MLLDVILVVLFVMAMFCWAISLFAKADTFGRYNGLFAFLAVLFLAGVVFFSGTF